MNCKFSDWLNWKLFTQVNDGGIGTKYYHDVDKKKIGKKKRNESTDDCQKSANLIKWWTKNRN